MSGVIGGEIQLTDQLRADMGVRVEYNNLRAGSENTRPVDLDDDPTTTFDNMKFGNNTFRHFTHDITDWAGSLGLNYMVNDNLAVFAAGSRGYKMPALDDLLDAQARPRWTCSTPARCESIEGGVKTQLGRVAFTVNGFYTDLKNQIGQGAEFDAGTGRTDLGVPGIAGQPLLRRRARGHRGAGPGAPVPGQRHLPRRRSWAAAWTVSVPQGSRGSRSCPGTLGTWRRRSRRPGPSTSSSGPTGTGSAPASPRTRSRGPLDIDPAVLPVYNYFNFGAEPRIPGAGVRLNADLLNAFQSKGLEEGNPALSAVGGTPFFLARPLLPRRLLVGVSYDFGAGGGATVEAEPGQ